MKRILLAIIALTCVTAAPTKRLTAGSAVPQCTNKTAADLNNFIRFSGVLPDQLGYYDSCLSHSDSMKYVLLVYVNKIKVKTEIFTGICVAKGCTEEELGQFYQAQAEKIFPKGLYRVDARDPNDEKNRPKKDAGYWSFWIFNAVLTLFILGATVVSEARKRSLHHKKEDDFLVTRSTVKNLAGAQVPGAAASVLTQLPGTEHMKVDGGESLINKPKHKETPFLVLFDLATNMKSLIYPRIVNSSVQVFDLLRVLAMIWIILGHELAYRMTVSANFLDKGFLDYTKDSWFFTYNMSAFYAVDIFLFMGGYVSIVSMSKLIYSVAPLKPTKAVVLYLFLVFKRYIRIMPPYALLLWYWYKVAPTFVEGPLSQGQLDMWPCNWTNFWQSFILGWRSDVNKRTMCAGWAWYLAIDFQIFLTIPIILMLSTLFGRKKKLAGIVMCTTLALASLVVTFIEGFNHKYQYLNPRDQEQTMNTYYYAKSIQRAVMYYVGCLFAYMTQKDDAKKPKPTEKPAEGPVLSEAEQQLLEERKKHRKVRAIRKMQLINFAGGFTGLLGVTLLLHFVFQWGRDIQKVGTLWNVVFIALGKIVFVICFMMVLLVIGFRFKGFGKYLAENRLVQLIANISFTMYLFHFTFIMIRTYSQRSIPTCTGIDLFSAGMADLTLTLFVGLYAALFVEIPAMNLWRVYCEGYLTAKLKKK